MSLPITLDMQLAVSQRYTYDLRKTSEANLHLMEDNFHDELINVFYEPAKFKASRFNKFPLPIILNYLRKTHKLYLNRKLGEIQLELNQLTFKEDSKQYWLPMLLQLFSQFGKKLTSHIEDEENNLFPYIDSLIDAKESKIIRFNIEQKIELVSFLLQHDDFAEESIRFIINLLEKEAPQFCNQLALGVLISRLKVFEIDLLVHAKIEDEVLIPKAMQLEIDLLSDIDIDFLDFQNKPW